MYTIIKGFYLLWFSVSILNFNIAQTQYVIDQNGTFSPIIENGTIIYLSDDEVSGPIPIGFTFSLFEEQYDTLFISSNGFVTFSPNGGDGCCQGQLLPDPDLPNNLIAFAWDDLNPGEGDTISYFLSGNIPGRKFIIDFKNIAQYNGDPITVQLTLIEGSNQLEIYTIQMSSDGKIGSKRKTTTITLKIG